MHLHIENSTSIGEVFEITSARLTSALKRYPDIAKSIKFTIGYDGENFNQHIKDATALFAWDFPRDDLTAKAPQLKWIQLHGAGISHLLPLDWLPTNITLTNSRGVHGKRAVEYIIMALLALNNGLPKIMMNQQNKLWHGVNSSSIEGKTLLIFGVGHIGGDVARAAKQFGLKVTGIRRSAQECDGVDEMYAPTDLTTLLPKADFVLVAAPHTPETDRIFNSETLSLLKDGAGLIVYSRSRLIDYDALMQGLRSNKFSAVVDVYDQEPLPKSSPLWQTPNLIITPHSSSNDPVHHAARSLDILFNNLRRFITGEELNNQIDRTLQY